MNSTQHKEALSLLKIVMSKTECCAEDVVITDIREKVSNAINLLATPPAPEGRTAEEILEPYRLHLFPEVFGDISGTDKVSWEGAIKAMHDYKNQFDRTQPEEWTPVNEGMPDFGRLIEVRGCISWKKDKSEVYFIDELTPETESLEYGEIGYLLKDRSDFIFYTGHFEIEEITSEYVTHWKYLIPVKK